MSGPILVTGGAGFIGSHTCKRLHADGFEPVVYDNLSTGHRDAVKWGPFVEGDILDSAALSAAIERFRPRALIHFAASAYVGESVADPAKYYRNNVDGTMTVLDSCRAGGGRGSRLLEQLCHLWDTRRPAHQRGRPAAAD
jgi:UDP-arabinose 4-epimerase